MLVVTTPGVPGENFEVRGMVSGEAIPGAKLFEDILASARAAGTAVRLR